MHVLGRFESLGHDSEFAVVQRLCGVAPTGVLSRAISTDISDVTQLVEQRFAGLFARDQLRRHAARGVTDTACHVEFDVVLDPSAPSEAEQHTAYLAARAQLDTAVAATLRRLDAGGGIFVYKSPQPPEPPQVQALLLALRRHGDNALLVVRAGADGAADQIEPHLFAGTISAFATGRWDLEGIRTAEWAALCRRIWRLRARTRPLPAVSPPGVATPVSPQPAADAQQKLAAALRLHREGKLREAAAQYRALLAADPGHADVLHLLGLALDAAGDAEQGLALIRQAIARHPAPRYLANLGLVLTRLARFDEAVDAYRQALAARPDYPEALNNLGLSLAALDRPAEAAAAHRDALALRPDFAEAQVNLGHALGLGGDLAGAVAAFRRGFALRPELNPAQAGGGPRGILFAASDARQPGAVYRCARMAQAAAACGWAARWLPLTEVREPDLRGVSVLVLWRGEMTGAVCRLIALACAAGIRVGLDLDDLICDPALASVAVVDGIRSMALAEADVAAQFARVRQVALAVDFATASTEEIARALRRLALPVWVLPNGFDQDSHRAARRARRARGHAPVVRIGYAAGTRTHQRDMQVIATALAAVLDQRPQAILVLFRDRDGGLVQPDEYPELARHAGRVEWRDAVPLGDLPGELARLDVNLAPLEVGNPFAEAKSELKYFEAALAGVPTVASPTGPFRRAIAHRGTGLLADDPASWTSSLLALIDDPALRARLAAAAYHDVLWRFGPQRRARAMAAMLAELGGGAAGARAFMAEAARPLAFGVPVAPAVETVFTTDDGRDSAASIVVLGESTECVAALDAAHAQDAADLDLLVITASDAVQRLALDWLRAKATRFHRAGLLRVAAAQGGIGNTGFAWAETPWVLLLHTDQTLPPTALSALLHAAEHGEAGFCVAAADRAGCEPRRLISGLLPAAPALVAKWAWAAAGGYATDAQAAAEAAFDLWCRLAALGIHGAVATDVPPFAAQPLPEAARRRLVARHPWLEAPA